MSSTVVSRRCRLDVAGELDEATRGSLVRLSTLRLNQPDVVQLDLDLSGVTFMGVGGLNGLLDIARVAESLGKLLRLIQPSVRVRRILDLTSTHDQFAIAPD